MKSQLKVFLLCLLQALTGDAMQSEINPHPPFEEPANVWDLDPDLPLDHQVIEMDGPMYDTLVTERLWGTPLNGDTPWVLLFTNKASIDDKRAMVNYKALAKKYAGQVRFALVVHSDENELLTAAFEAMFLPQTFLIKDGTAYWYRDFPYEDNLSRYIDEEGYWKSTTRFA